MIEQSKTITKSSFIIKDKNQLLIVEEWGKDSVRVINSPVHTFSKDDKNGIEELEKNTHAKISIVEFEEKVELINNNLKVIYDGDKLTFYNNDKKVLEEYVRKQSNVRRTIGIDECTPIEDLPSSSLNILPREFQYLSDGSYTATLRFEGEPLEKIYGLGGYQEKYLNKNSGTYELMQRNSQTSIPYYISNQNYSFIWNNASIGEVTFSKNQKMWKSNQTASIDYIVSVGENPKALMETFTTMTGRSPEIDTELLGLWQSKLRYQTIEELEEVYEGYKSRGIRLSVLVIDYFHWTADGDFEFDMTYWKGIKEFAARLKQDGTKLMVSLWPTVTDESKYYDLYQKHHMMIRGVNGQNKMFDGKEILDFSNPLTMEHIKKVLDRNYRNLGIDLFWADQAEPEMDAYKHKDYLIHTGNLEQYGNKYPYHYVKSVYDNVCGNNPVLIRSAWFNSQKYGALAWSGDIESSFDSLARQIQVNISMGLSGIPWWTSDIAGFHSGDSTKDSFKELMIRWFQFATFTPVLRMHGDRQPHTQRIGNAGGGLRTSGGPNEIWSFGEEVEKVLTNFIKIRENLKDYIEYLYKESSQTGYPIVRSLFFEFPEDQETWEETTNFMFGSELLVAPIVQLGAKEQSIYLPKGTNWTEVFSGKEYIGGETYTLELSIDKIPVFCREDSELIQIILKK